MSVNRSEIKTKSFIFVTLLIISFVYVTTCRRVGMWLVKNDEPHHADALVILMGSIPDRVLQASDLYRSGLADRVLIVEGHDHAYRELTARGAHFISGTAQAVDAAVALGIPADSIIILQGNSQSTKNEAHIIRNYLKDKPDIDTLLLVSSSHHTRRASMIFKNAFSNSGKSIQILCCPSPYTGFNAEKWWRDKEDIQIVILEYIKLFNFLLFEKKEMKDEK